MKRKNKRRKHHHYIPHTSQSFDIRQYIIAGIILLFGIVASIAILRRPARKVTAELENIPESPVQEILPTTYTVNFYDADGIRIDSRRVHNGEAVLPPQMELQDCVFKGWSNPTYEIEQDMDIYPLFQSFAGMKNVIYADAVYVNIADEFTVTIRLAGDVNCCSFTIIAAYDTDLLSLVNVQTLTDSLSIDTDAEKGTVRLTRESEKVLTEPAELARLYFSAKHRGDYETRIPMQTVEIDTIQDEIRVYTDSVAYDTDVYLLDFNKNEIQ